MKGFFRLYQKQDGSKKLKLVEECEITLKYKDSWEAQVHVMEDWADVDRNYARDLGGSVKVHRQSGRWHEVVYTSPERDERREWELLA